MSDHSNHYQVIDDFFDAYSLSHAVRALKKLVKTADAPKAWKTPCPANAIYFTERFQLLIEAAFGIVRSYDYRKEIMLDKDTHADYWLLDQYEIYCGWHSSSTPWDFFPRHLSKKEFLDPYKALKKFTRYQTLEQWKEILKDLCFHSLSPHSFSGYDDGASILTISIYLHKLLEATHLIEVRTIDRKIKPRKKWKDKTKTESQPQSATE